MYNNLISQSTECETGLANYSPFDLATIQLIQSPLLMINKNRQEKESKFIQLIYEHPIAHQISFNCKNYIDNTPIPEPHNKLKQMLYCNGPTPLSLCCLLFRQILQVLSPLHTLGIAHTNLDTNCINIAPNPTSDYQIYLTGFDNATFNNNLICENNRISEYYNENVLSPSYFPKHRDNYSLSVILYLMIFGFKSIIFDSMTSVEFLKLTGDISLNSKRVWGLHKKFLKQNGETLAQINEFKEVLDALRGKLYTPLSLILKYKWFGNSVKSSELGECMDRLHTLTLGISN